MLTKRITNTWNFHEPSIRKIFLKMASWYGDKLVTPEEGYTFCNALFLGSYEAWGPNQNGDAFVEKVLEECHPTFVSDAKHYKHHQNTDPTKCYGDVVSSYYNPKMRRVEGIIRIENAKSPAMIEKINRGEPVPLSMAAKLPFDVCSICEKKSTSTSEYCDHLKYEMMNIYPDGKIVCAFNPKPTFFDISEVVKGADRTAFTLKKVASFGELNKISSLGKNAILERLAFLEKNLDGLITGKSDIINTLREKLGDETDIDNMSSPELLGALSESGIVENFKNDMKKESVFSYLRDNPDLVGNQVFIKNNKFNNFLKKSSLLSEYSCDRINGNYKMLNKQGLVKSAILTVNSILVNPTLLNDKLYPSLAILKNKTY